MNCSRMIWTKGWIHPILQNRPIGKTASAARNWINFPPPNWSLCLVFCINPSSPLPTELFSSAKQKYHVQKSKNYCMYILYSIYSTTIALKSFHFQLFFGSFTFSFFFFFLVFLLYIVHYNIENWVWNLVRTRTLVTLGCMLSCFFVFVFFKSHVRCCR